MRKGEGGRRKGERRGYWCRKGRWKLKKGRGIGKRGTRHNMGKGKTERKRGH